jgi:excisionase family DNA binding protein
MSLNWRDRPSLTIAEACEVAGWSRATFNRLMDRGELRRIKVGRLVRVPTADLLTLLGESAPARDAS